MLTLLDILDSLEYFSATENWGDPGRVSWQLGYMLDDYRKVLDRPVHISPVEGAVHAEGKGHSEDSRHYSIAGRNEGLSDAADIFPEGDLFRAWLLAIKSPFGGVGVYPYWKWPAKGLIGGIHVDCRPLEFRDAAAFWWVDKTGAYRSMTREEDCAALMGVLVNFRMRARAGRYVQ